MFVSTNFQLCWVKILNALEKSIDLFLFFKRNALYLRTIDIHDAEFSFSTYLDWLLPPG